MTSGAFIIGLLTGACLGVASMLGLWLTVRRLSEARYPGLMVAASAAARLLLLAAVFYGLAQIGVFALLGGAIGVLATRLVVIVSFSLNPLRPGTGAGSELA